VVVLWLQSTVYGMGFAFALIVAKKRNLLSDTGPSQSGLCRVFIWVSGFLSVAGLIVSSYRKLLICFLLHKM